MDHTIAILTLKIFYTVEATSLQAYYYNRISFLITYYF